jgi:hypothetical protein
LRANAFNSWPAVSFAWIERHIAVAEDGAGARHAEAVLQVTGSQICRVDAGQPASLALVAQRARPKCRAGEIERLFRRATAAYAQSSMRAARLASDSLERRHARSVFALPIFFDSSLNGWSISIAPARWWPSKQRAAPVDHDDRGRRRSASLPSWRR